MAQSAHASTPLAGGPMGYVPALDGVRALAALAVLATHVLQPLAPLSPLLIAQGGSLGVDVFFTLSGFLITTLLVEEHQRRGTIDLRAFWVRRTLRLMPALLFVIAALIVLGALVDAGILATGQGLQAETRSLVGRPTFLSFWQGIPVTLIPVSNWFVALKTEVFSPLAVAWTLAIEDQFYLVWPFALLLLLTWRGLTPRTRIVLIVAVAGVAALWRNVLLVTGTPPFWVSRRTDARIDEILIGCALGLVLTAHGVPTSPRVRHILGLVAWGSLVGLVVAFFTISTDETMSTDVSAVQQVGFTLVGMLTAALIAHLVVDRASGLSRLLAWPALVGIGQISYGLYLWHWVWFGYVPGKGAERIPTVIVLTSISVLVSYYLVERPALRLKQRFARVDHYPRSSLARHEAPRHSRRDLLPLVGTASLAVAALVTSNLGTRIYPNGAIAERRRPKPTSVPEPTRVPRRKNRTARPERTTTQTPP